MNITINHPENSLEAVQQAIINQSELKRSPHVGNVNRNELAIIHGVPEQLGGFLRVEMVDTIQADDRYASPNKVLFATQEDVKLLSSRQSKGRVVGSAQLSSDAVLAIKRSCFPRFQEAVEGMSLTELHMSALKKILSYRVSIRTSSEFFASMGDSALREVLTESQKVLERPLRKVDETGKIKPLEGAVPPDDIFGVGTEPGKGVLPPLEAMMAIELLQMAQAHDGGDSQIVHIAGPDMIRYTKDAAIMEPTVAIAQSVGATLGIRADTTIEYVVPDMHELLQSEPFINVLPENIVSQYDAMSYIA